MTISWQQTHWGALGEATVKLSRKDVRMNDDAFNLRMKRLRGAKVECYECGDHIAEQPDRYHGNNLIHPGCRPLGRCYGCDRVVRHRESYASIELPGDGGTLMVHERDGKPDPDCAREAENKIATRRRAEEKAEAKRERERNRQRLMKAIRDDARNGLKTLVLCPLGEVRDMSAKLRSDRAAQVFSNQSNVVSVAFHDSAGTVTFRPNDSYVGLRGADKVVVMYDALMAGPKRANIRDHFMDADIYFEERDADFHPFSRDA